MNFFDVPAPDWQQLEGAVSSAFALGGVKAANVILDEIEHGWGKQIAKRVLRGCPDIIRADAAQRMEWAASAHFGGRKSSLHSLANSIIGHMTDMKNAGLILDFDVQAIPSAPGQIRTQLKLAPLGDVIELRLDL